MENKKANIFDKIKKIKGLEFIIIGIVAFLIIVILFSDGTLFKSRAADNDTVEEYVSSLEARLEKTLSQVKGAGRVKVVISVAGGNKTVIASDVKTVKNGNELQVTETPVLVGGKVVVLNELYPEVSGVLIVASGASSVSVKVDLVNAVTTFLSVEPSKVKILTGK